MMSRSSTRRDLLRAAAAGGAALTLPTLAGSTELVQRALAATQPPGCGALADIEHIIFVVQENHSFDSYWGSYHGTRGFSDPSVLPLGDGSGLNVFSQPGYPASGYGGHLDPFHIDTSANGECTNDVTHDWGPQHRSWNAGAMNGFVSEHVAELGPTEGAITMGYYERADLPFYYALADAFTLCDNYHCSVMGPSDPNHLMLISGTIDPAGTGGGPVYNDYSLAGKGEAFGTLTWTTMAEQLEARKISWKAYNDGPTAENPFSLFKTMQSNPVLQAKGVTPTFPADFLADIHSGALPSVSWVYASEALSEHPPFPVTAGEATTASILDALLANPGLWAKTALFITWDENGGYFDHVPQLTPPPGTPGEFLTVANPPSDTQGILGPIGLGFRVGLLVVSPFSRGGLVCSDSFDHTSMMRFLEARFGAEVPNVSAWRRSVTGDLTSAFNFAAAAQTAVPTLPAPSPSDPRITDSDSCQKLAASGGSVIGATDPYPVPPNALPAQEPGARGATPSGLAKGTVVPCREATPVLRAAIHNVPRRAGRKAFRVLVAITHSAGLRQVRVRLNGRLVHTTRRARFTVTIRPREELHGRRNTIAVAVVNVNGRKTTAVAHFQGPRR